MSDIDDRLAALERAMSALTRATTKPTPAPNSTEAWDLVHRLTTRTRAMISMIATQRNLLADGDADEIGLDRALTAASSLCAEVLHGVDDLYEGLLAQGVARARAEQELAELRDNPLMVLAAGKGKAAPQQPTQPERNSTWLAVLQVKDGEDRVIGRCELPADGREAEQWLVQLAEAQPLGSLIYLARNEHAFWSGKRRIEVPALGPAITHRAVAEQCDRVRAELIDLERLLGGSDPGQPPARKTSARARAHLMREALEAIGVHTRDAGGARMMPSIIVQARGDERTLGYDIMLSPDMADARREADQICEALRHTGVLAKDGTLSVRIHAARMTQTIRYKEAEQ